VATIRTEEMQGEQEKIAPSTGKVSVEAMQVVAIFGAPGRN